MKLIVNRSPMISSTRYTFIFARRVRIAEVESMGICRFRGTNLLTGETFNGPLYDECEKKTIDSLRSCFAKTLTFIEESELVRGKPR